MNEIDVTLSVVIDNTTSECEQVIQELMEKHRLAPDTMELILERVLANIRAVKCRLYASAIISKQSCKEEKVEKI